MTPIEIECRGCGAKLLVEPQLRTAHCPYCDSPAVIERPPSVDRPDPSFVVGFVLDEKAARARVAAWLRSRGPFTPGAFKKAAPHKTRAVYLPVYLYGVVARTSFAADIGENYTEQQRYTTTDAKGRAVVRTRTVTRTEWRELAGEHAGYVIDVMVTASGGLPNAALAAIEPFDLRALRRYTPAVLSGWIAEEPSLDRASCLELARAEAAAEVTRRLEAFMPGDSHRNVRPRMDFHDEMLDLVLVPLWVFAVRPDADKPPIRIVVNGQTGKLEGKVPTSAARVLAAIGLALLVAIIVWLIVVAL